MTSLQQFRLWWDKYIAQGDPDLTLSMEGEGR
jgi:hypothetical protein